MAILETETLANLKNKNEELYNLDKGLLLLE